MGDEALSLLVAVGAGIGAVFYGALKYLISKKQGESAAPVVSGIAGALTDQAIGERLIGQFERLNDMLDRHSRETVVATKRSSEEMIELRKVMQAICEKIPRN